MKDFLKNIKDTQSVSQEQIQDKLNKGLELTDMEISQYQLSDSDAELLGLFKRVIDGENVQGFELKDFLGSPMAKILIPRVIIGAVRKTQEANYIASKLFKKIRLKNGQAMIFPSFGHVRAHDLAEGQEIPQEALVWQKHKNSFISATKSGVRIQFSEELLAECEFDIVSIMLEECGRALSRHKEEKAYVEFMSHGWTVFDNALRAKDPIKWAEAGTNGVDFENNLNDGLAVEDMLDLLIAIYNNGNVCTDLLIHPLAWVALAKNGLTGSLTALSQAHAVPEKPDASFKIGPSSMQGRLPFNFNVNLSPFAPLDKENKTFSMFAVDRNAVGFQIVKSDLKMEEFRDPSRDLKNIKLTEAYAFAVKNEGRAICSAKNIAMSKCWPTPERVITLNK